MFRQTKIRFGRLRKKTKHFWENNARVVSHLMALLGSLYLFAFYVETSAFPNDQTVYFFLFGIVFGAAEKKIMFVNRRKTERHLVRHWKL